MSCVLPIAFGGSFHICTFSSNRLYLPWDSRFSSKFCWYEVGVNEILIRHSEYVFLSSVVYRIHFLTLLHMLSHASYLLILSRKVGVFLGLEVNRRPYLFF